MDILDFIDVETKQKKSHRVRSWYLYEQYKSLERNQLDAAQKLKERSNQDRILLQELQERRSRRRLYDQFDMSCKSECLVHGQGSIHDGDKTTLSASSDDFFESFCELQDEKTNNSDPESSMGETFSQDDSQIGKRYLHEFKSLEDMKDDLSYAESISSVVEKDLAAELTEKLSIVQKNIAELDQCLAIGNCHTTPDDDKKSEVASTDSEDVESKQVITHHHRRQESDINLYNIWTKLVSFAYQVTQLNHGNCYYDYGSQFLTAVLACDVLRRGVNCMCHILQPYVSPIKYSTDISESDASSICHKSTKRKTLPTYKKISNKIKSKQKQTCRPNEALRCKTKRTHYSDEYWRKLSKYTFGYKNNKRYRASEPCPSKEKFSSYYTGPSEMSSSLLPSLSRQESAVDCPCSCHVKVVNPMLKIGEYIDRLLKDIDDSSQQL